MEELMQSFMIKSINIFVKKLFAQVILRENDHYNQVQKTTTVECV